MKWDYNVFRSRDMDNITIIQSCAEMEMAKDIKKNNDSKRAPAFHLITGKI